MYREILLCLTESGNSNITKDPIYEFSKDLLNKYSGQKFTRGNSYLYRWMYSPKDPYESPVSDFIVDIQNHLPNTQYYLIATDLDGEICVESGSYENNPFNLRVVSKPSFDLAKSDFIAKNSRGEYPNE